MNLERQPMRSKLAKNALFDACAHAVGTATAHKRDSEEGVISCQALIIAGILMVLLAQWIAVLL